MSPWLAVSDGTGPRRRRGRGKAVWQEGFMMLTRLIRPLRSRKVRVALATVAAAYAAQFGLNVSQEVVMTILGVGVSLILGIAHEDSGRARAQ